MVLLNNFLPGFMNDILAVAYGLLLAYTIFRILLDTQSTSKALGYILLVVVLPLIGMLFYFSFGINYRHKKRNKKRTTALNEFTKSYKESVPDDTKELLKKYAGSLNKYNNLIHFIHSLGGEKLSVNEYKLLINGEEKFPEVLKTLETAKHFIHMEYYDWENDTRGNQIKDVLLRKMEEVFIILMFLKMIIN